MRIKKIYTPTHTHTPTFKRINGIWLGKGGQKIDEFDIKMACNNNNNNENSADNAYAHIIVRFWMAHWNKTKHLAVKCGWYERNSHRRLSFLFQFQPKMKRMSNAIAMKKSKKKIVALCSHIIIPTSREWQVEADDEFEWKRQSTHQIAKIKKRNGWERKTKNFNRRWGMEYTDLFLFTHTHDKWCLRCLLSLRLSVVVAFLRESVCVCVSQHTSEKHLKRSQKRRINVQNRYVVDCYCSIHIDLHHCTLNYITLHKQLHRNVEISFSGCGHCLNVHKIVVCLCDTITNESI